MVCTANAGGGGGRKEFGMITPHGFFSQITQGCKGKEEVEKLEIWGDIIYG